MTRRIPRILARAPIPLYRAGFGFLLGRRLTMLEHRGRISGLPRYVVLEVLERDDDGLVVVSGYGDRAQWYRNVLAHPGGACGCGRGACAVRPLRQRGSPPRTCRSDWRPIATGILARQ